MAQTAPSAPLDHRPTGRPEARAPEFPERAQGAHALLRVLVCVGCAAARQRGSAMPAHLPLLCGAHRQGVRAQEKVSAAVKPAAEVAAVATVTTAESAAATATRGRRAVARRYKKEAPLY